VISHASPAAAAASVDSPMIGVASKIRSAASAETLPER
jgi:hypothetical protein